MQARFDRRGKRCHQVDELLCLQLHVQQGLCLVQARLLLMEVGANISSAGLDPAGCKDAASTNGESLVKMDPYRGSWGV